jgi:hypothetical protein
MRLKTICSSSRTGGERDRQQRHLACSADRPDTEIRRRHDPRDASVPMEPFAQTSPRPGRRTGCRNRPQREGSLETSHVSMFHRKSHHRIELAIDRACSKWCCRSQSHSRIVDGLRGWRWIWRRVMGRINGFRRCGELGPQSMDKCCGGRRHRRCGGLPHWASAGQSRPRAQRHNRCADMATRDAGPASA